VTYRPGLTALQALLDAGGPKDTAHMDEVVVLQKVSDQQYRAAKINLAEMLENGKTGADVGLNPADVVFVPKTSIAKFDQWVDQYLVKSLPFRLVVPVW
jgi:protein involved in polysaccharide export with SLBB domain